MAITNLNEYYASKGQALPSVSQRAGLASQAGISNYIGSAQQNAILLKSLNSPTPATNVNTTGIPTNTPAPTPAPVIPVGVVTSPQNQMPLPEKPTNTSNNALGAAAGAMLEQPKINTLGDVAGAVDIAQKNADMASKDYSTNILDLINQIGTAQSDANTQYNIQQLNTDQRTAKSKYDAIELQYRRQAEAETTNPALSSDQKTARLAEIDRKKSSQLADIAIDYNLKAGLYNDAKTLIADEVKAKLDTARLKVDYYKTIKEDYSGILDKLQTTQLNKLLKEEEQDFQVKQDKIKFQQQVQLKAMDIASEAQKKGVDLGLTYDQIKGIKNYNDLAKFSSTALATANGVPKDISKNIGESKTGQKVNATLGFSKSLKEYTALFKSYVDSGTLSTVDAQANLKTLRGNLDQAYSVANGQGAVQSGDRESYNKIIAGGLSFPKVTLTQLDTLAKNMDSTAKNDILFLNQTYGGYADKFFQPQIDEVTLVEEKAKYKGLSPEDVIVKYTVEHPDKKQIIDEMLKVEGVTMDMITQQLGLDKLIN